MKKIFQLHLPNHADARVLEAIKGDLSKYLKRERRKALPEGVDFWDFDCKVGPDRESPVVTHLSQVSKAVEAIAQAGGAQVYVEILARPGHRTKKITTDSPAPESL